MRYFNFDSLIDNYSSLSLIWICVDLFYFTLLKCATFPGRVEVRFVTVFPELHRSCFPESFLGLLNF